MLAFDFDLERCERMGQENHARYLAATPFPHVVLDDFLPSEVAEALLAEFPHCGHPCWSERDRGGSYQPGKLGILHARNLAQVGSFVRYVLAGFASFPFVSFLEKLSGIPGLIPDPHLVGAGLHQTIPGGWLQMHVDFNFHSHLKLFRRVNVLYYLNKNWQPEQGGGLVLQYGEHGEERVVVPSWNRLVVFSTSRNAWHGHPEPVRCSPDDTRKSLALYFYTAEAAPDDPIVRPSRLP